MQSAAPAKRGRPALRWLSALEAAEALDWDPAALERLLASRAGAELFPGAVREPEGWTVPESALRRVTGAGLFLFSVPRLAELLDCDAGTLRRMIRAGKLRAVRLPGIGQRVPWSEYQRLTGRVAR
jgi:excisionase family DNA binding protein